MTVATVLIPVHKHAEPLRYAIASVLNQSLQNFEIFLVGDGVDDATRSVIDEVVAADNRIRFFDFPKGPRKGELHWHRALQEARGRIVAYLGSDDCWMPNHLEVLDGLLTDADFGHTLHVSVNPDGQIVALAADVQNPAFRNRMLTERFNRFDFSFGGHTVAAYHRLPNGWCTIPPDFPYADLYMWRQFLAEPWCRARSALIPTGIHTATSLYPHLSDRERGEDLAHWYRQIAEPTFREGLWREISQRFGTRSVAFELKTRSLELKTRSLKAKREQSQIALKRQRKQLKRQRKQLEQARSRIRHLERKRAALAKSLAAMRCSTSWKVTSPLRRIRLIAAKLVGQGAKR